ncbi:MAG TPA: dihydrofolate reductase family protein [Pyrinomonadaceae bacterium]|nr:dihydrofolate reductase family protein [Pyrinomonadaceae bacterium]
MRRVRYAVAASLDGYIADTEGGADWIVHDAEMDFAALFAQFDTFLVGRRTFEFMARAGRERIPGAKMIVFSRTLRQEDWPGVTVVADGVEETVAALRGEEGKDIWLFGGGSLFRSLLDAGLVDTVEIAIIPVLLGDGTPLLPPPARQTKLNLTGHKVYKSGIIRLEYSVRKNDD